MRTKRFNYCLSLLYVLFLIFFYFYQELKAITARRIACSGESTAKPARKPGAYINPAGTYQTATPQQLEAAGIKPIILPNSNRPQDRFQANKEKEWDTNDKVKLTSENKIFLIIESKSNHV